jgi:hypothetical protein
VTNNSCNRLPGRLGLYAAAHVSVESPPATSDAELPIRPAVPLERGAVHAAAMCTAVSSRDAALHPTATATAAAVWVAQRDWYGAGVHACASDVRISPVRIGKPG